MTLGWGVDSNAADMKRLHARNVRQLAVLQAKLDTTRGKLAGAEARAVRAEAALIAVKGLVGQRIYEVVLPTVRGELGQANKITREIGELIALAAAVPVVGAEELTEQATTQYYVPCGCYLHGDHLGCGHACKSARGCTHPLGKIVTRPGPTDQAEAQQ